MAPRCLVMPSTVNEQVQVQLPLHDRILLSRTQTFDLRPSQLPIQPDGRQVLVDVMTRAYLEAFNIASVRHDAVTPEQEGFVRLGVQHSLLELAHQVTLPRKIRLTKHPV